MLGVDENEFDPHSEVDIARILVQQPGCQSHAFIQLDDGEGRVSVWEYVRSPWDGIAIERALPSRVDDAGLS
jgi:hypothetical protein